MKMVQKLYKRVLTCAINVDHRTKEIVMTMAFFIMFSISAINYVFDSSFRMRAIAPIYGCIFVIIMLCMIDKELERGKWNKPLVVTWGLFSILMVVSGIINSYQYLVCGVFFLVLVPCYIFVCNNCSNDRLYISFAKGNVLTFLWIAVFSVLFQSVNHYHGYTGILKNQNALGYYLGVTAICLLFLVDRNKKFGNLVILGCVLALVYLSRSRTTMLMVLSSTVLWLGEGVFKRFDGKKIISKIKSLLIAVLFAVFFVVAIMQIGGIGKKVVYFFWDNIEMDNAEDEDKNILDKIGAFQQVLEDKITLEEKNLSQYSNGRFDIWIAFSKELNLRGHSPSYRFKIGERGINSTAHNTILQIAYENGIVCGLLFVIYIVLTGKQLIHCYLKREDMGIVVMINVCYWISMLLSSVYNPMFYITALAFVIMQAPLWKKEDERNIRNE